MTGEARVGGARHVRHSVAARRVAPVAPGPRRRSWAFRSPQRESDESLRV
jgi:hypothetical protein